MNKKYMKSVLFFMLFIMINIKVFSQELQENPLVHYAGMNIGSTTIFNTYTSMHIGLNYELKKLNGKLGIGYFGDFIFGPNLEFIMGFPIYWHNVFGEDLYLCAGTGFGLTRSLNYAKDIETADSDLSNDFTRINFLLRFGAGWEFFVKEETSGREFMKINPYINVDILAMYKTYLSIGISASYYIY